MKFARIVTALVCAFAAAPASAATIGLGIYVSNGVYSPGLDSAAPGQLHVLDDGAQRHLAEFDVASKLPTTDALGLSPVQTSGTFAALDWTGIHQVPCRPDGTVEDWRFEIDNVHWMRTRCYRGAAWMSSFAVLGATPLDSTGSVTGLPLVGVAGSESASSLDTWWERRFVARVVTHNCVGNGDCSNADSYRYAEALVQARGNQRPEFGAVAIPACATQLRLSIVTGGSIHALATVPVYHDQPSTPYGYGLRASLARITAYPPSGYFLPGSTVQFQVSYFDGGGVRFFSPGSLPSYGAAIFEDPSAAGVRYLTYVDDPVLYWAHKNTQSDMTFTVAGPLDKMNRVGQTPITIAQAFDPQIPEATVADSGYDAVVQIFPPTYLVFPCLFSLLGGAPAPECFVPVSDIFTITIPADAQSGTWSAQIKARRLWEGEPLQAAASALFQVGQAATTNYAPKMSGCTSCHIGHSSVGEMEHGFPLVDGELAECISCHTKGYDAWFEPDAGFDKRMSYVHLLSQRFFSMGGTAAQVTYPNP